MFKTIALYKQIEDPQSFIRFYVHEFVPKMLALPGVVKLEINHLYPSLMSGPSSEEEPTYFLLCETYFESAEALDQLLKSPEGLELARLIMEEASEFMTAYVAMEEVHSK